MGLVLLVDRREHAHVLTIELGQGSSDGGCTDSEHARDCCDAAVGQDW